MRKRLPEMTNDVHINLHPSDEPDIPSCQRKTAMRTRRQRDRLGRPPKAKIAVTRFTYAGLRTKTHPRGNCNTKQPPFDFNETTRGTNPSDFSLRVRAASRLTLRVKSPHDLLPTHVATVRCEAHRTAAEAAALPNSTSMTRNEFRGLSLTT